MIYYCPSCWAEIASQTEMCPACGADIRDFAGESYELKLIRALRHPEPTVPLRAATILGELQSKAAVPALIETATRTEDPYLQEAAVKALGALSDEAAAPCLERLSREGALRVRIAARHALGLLGRHARQ